MHRSLLLTLQKENCIVSSIFVDFFFFFDFLLLYFLLLFCLLICLAELLFLSDVVVTWAGGRIKRMAVRRPGISLLTGPCVISQRGGSGVEKVSASAVSGVSLLESLDCFFSCWFVLFMSYDVYEIYLNTLSWACVKICFTLFKKNKSMIKSSY